MSIVVVLELDESLAVRVIGSGEQPADIGGVRQAHAAPSNPDIPSDPGPTTLCGLGTTGMLTEHWSPGRPGARWFPPRWSDRVCLTCDAAVRAS